MASLLIESSWIRSEVVRKILERFEAALPLYKDMMEVARTINDAAGEAEAARLGKVMHAAIRCASMEELQLIRDLFAVMSNEPVNYYDLRERVSVESTAFRPVDADEIELNGFRIFCSMLSMECIDEPHRDFVQSIVSRRNLFDDELRQLMTTAKENGGLDQSDALRFVDKCVDLFTRPEEALISFEEYQRLGEINKVAAQVLISNSLAFNHLTPSVASVPAAHEEMQKRGIQTIPVWQGPVGKDVILRQTSCLAPPVVLKFPNGDGTFVEAEYQETFVEFEERLQALTRKGRLQFEALFAEGKSRLSLAEKDANYAKHYYETMSTALAEFPSDPLRLWREGLAYFSYEVAEPSRSDDAKQTFESAVESGAVTLVAQQYEDFFGPAATNIFNSNIGLDDVSHVGVAQANSQAAFEKCLGREVVDMYDYYDSIEARSKHDVCLKLGIE